MRCAIQFPVFHAHSPVNPECVSSWATAKDPTALRMQCGILRSAQNDMVMGRADPLIGPLKLSTKCRQLEGQKWELPKKFPFLHGLYVKGDSPSPFTDPSCKTNLVCKGLSTV